MLSNRFIPPMLAAVGVMISLTVAVALASTGEAELPLAGPSPRAAVVSGAFTDSPQPGEVVFRAAGLEPGDTTDGTVLVTNGGDSRGMFWLSRTGFSDRQGAAGGTLSERLQVTVLDVTSPDASTLVYSGGITEMGARPLGFVAPGKSRIYSVAATLLPDPGSTTNPYEGSSTSISFKWGAIAGEPPATSSSAAEPRAGDADKRAPQLRLDIPAHQRLLNTGSLVVNVRCDEACRLNAAGRLRAEGAPRSAVTTESDGKPGKRVAVRVTFKTATREAMRRALVARRSVPVKFRVVARDGNGNRTVETRDIMLRPIS